MVRIGIWCGHHAFLTVFAGFAAYTLGLYGLGMPFSACLFFLLLFPAWEDFRTGFISDTWSFLLGLCGLATSFRAGRPAAGLASGALVFLILGGLYLCFRQGVGTGDLFLASAAALWLTPLHSLLFLWFSSLAALLFLAVPLLRGKRQLREGIAFGPFLGAGAFLSYVLLETGFLPEGFPIP